MKTATLAELVDGYLTMRVALGYRVNSSDRSMLHGFASLAEQRRQPITAEMAVTWACSSPRHGATTRSYRLCRLRGFLKYLQAFRPDTEVPGSSLLAAGRRPMPYIYTEQEIGKLLRAATTLKRPGFVRRADPAKLLLPHTYQTLIGLLACTGLRVGEALRLDLHDVQLHEKTPRLLVRNTKFGKSRLVPLHDSVAERLERYRHQRRDLGYDDLTPAFFVSEQGRRLKYGSVNRTWHVLLRRTELTPTADGRRPTLHAARHSFAVRRLVEWHRRGLDVSAMMPHLSVYMGHAEPASTYWYLSATPELLELAAGRFEQYVAKGGAR